MDTWIIVLIVVVLAVAAACAGVYFYYIVGNRPLPGFLSWVKDLFDEEAEEEPTPVPVDPAKLPMQASPTDLNSAPVEEEEKEDLTLDEREEKGPAPHSYWYRPLEVPPEFISDDLRPFQTNKGMMEMHYDRRNGLPVKIKVDA